MAEKIGLSPEAYERIPGDKYQPYIAKEVIQAEFTIKAVILGCVFGIIFGAANAYLGLRVGLTISTSIPLAVMAVAFFRLLGFFRIPSTILESNIAKTVGSASSSLASGIIFTIPALFLWGFSPGLAKITIIALAGGVLGVLFMVPLRRFLIKEEHGELPYPEGTASAEVLVAAETGGASARNVFMGMGIGAVYKWIMSGLTLWKEIVNIKIPFIKKAQIGLDNSPALLGVGYILGFRIATIMVAGGLLSSLVLIPAIAYWGDKFTSPVFPETELLISQMSPYLIWTRYIRYLGAGAVAAAGIISLIRSVPTMVRSFSAGIKQLKDRFSGKVVQLVRTERDLSLIYVIGGAVLVALFLAVVPQVFQILQTFPAKLLAAILVAIFAFFFVTVSSRIVGLVGVTSNPTSGMIIATLIGTSLIFLLMGWTGSIGKVAALSIGAVVGVAASIAGDTSQDLKTGFLLGATPSKQQVGEIIGVLSTAIFIAGTVLLLQQQYGFGTVKLPAPQANMMKLVIDGVLERQIPWRFVLIGVGITIVVELFRIPSLPFAVGVYLPLSTMSPVFVGGLIRKIIESRCADKQSFRRRREQGILYGSGLVAGVGMAGVGIAFWAVFFGIPEGFGHEWQVTLQNPIALLLFCGLVYLLVRSTKLKKKD